MRRRARNHEAMRRTDERLVHVHRQFTEGVNHSCLMLFDPKSASFHANSQELSARGLQLIQEKAEMLAHQQLPHLRWGAHRISRITRQQRHAGFQCATGHLGEAGSDHARMQLTSDLQTTGMCTRQRKMHDFFDESRIVWISAKDAQHEVIEFLFKVWTRQAVQPTTQIGLGVSSLLKHNVGKPSQIRVVRRRIQNLLKERMMKNLP
mmetsp:Transcript_15862/g.40597  ORF Transcript_15862/g.40597 Transcript_15862/m.40597 type:complete len:207 (+) Transcript_15862:688-1308(+)